MRATMTVREIRKELFDTNYAVTVNTVDMTNKQARDFFYMFDNQDKVLKIVKYEITETFAVSLID